MATPGIQQILSFDPKVNEWNVFIKRLEQYFIVNQITDDKLKRANLLYSLAEEAYLLLINLCMPSKPEEESYKDIIKLLNEYYGQTSVVWIERKTFYDAVKLEGESVQEWSVKLKGLAKNCNFGETLDTKLVDIFISHFNPGKIRTELCSLKEDVSFIEAVKKAKVVEASLSINESAVEVKRESTEGEVFQVSRKYNQVPAQWNPNSRRGHPLQNQQQQSGSSFQ